MKPYGSKRQDRGRISLDGKQCICCPDKGGFKKGRARQQAKRETYLESLLK